MISFSKYKVILWDFDGVIMDSMPVRDRGFEIVLASYPQNEVEQLLQYHRQNGGLSRYVKFRYFFEQIRKEQITDEQVLQLATDFSTVMKKELVNSELLIQETVAYVKRCHQRFRMHVVSGSDEKELQYLCKTLGLGDYFVSIHGSPTPKIQLVSDTIRKYNYETSEVCLIGDSKNDLEAATVNGIDFYGFNNGSLKPAGAGYIQSFNEII
jgi:phosphoglycolate phosphatase-like HAD superfamily hydrolase